MKLRRELGQHLLVEQGILRRIAMATGAGPDDLIIEIGPGTGNLTRSLLATGARVIAIELDERLADTLERRIGPDPSLTVIRSDILKADLEEIVPESDRPALAVGNLPYYISSAIIFKLLENRDMFRSIVVLVQKEVGERMASPPGSRAFGMLSVFCQAEAECRILFNVGRDEFRPVPDVDSCLVHLDPLPIGSAGIEDREMFELIVHGLFEHKRKTCYNSLRMSMDRGACAELLPAGSDIEQTVLAAFSEIGIDGSKRPEQLDVKTIVALSNYFARRRY
ncbi:MAG: 16S rRNA (adenine(1518)-N(6)/adenine(1519)-N(6))-dimethyltransferase RsmA [bacterium]